MHLQFFTTQNDGTLDSGQKPALLMNRLVSDQWIVHAEAELVSPFGTIDVKDCQVRVVVGRHCQSTT
jgi:hypothetical protein